MLMTTRFIVLTHRKPEEGAANGTTAYEELRFFLDKVGNGQVRSVESRGDVLGSLIELAADTPEEAQALVDSLPGVRAGLEKAVVIPVQEYGPFRALADSLI